MLFPFYSLLTALSRGKMPVETTESTESTDRKDFLTSVLSVLSGGYRVATDAMRATINAL
jgi:hypothetical protein